MKRHFTHYKSNYFDIYFDNCFNYLDLTWQRISKTAPEDKCVPVILYELKCVHITIWQFVNT